VSSEQDSTGGVSLTGLATMYSNIGRQLASHSSAQSAFVALTETALQIVPGAEYAGITRGRVGRFETIAPTDPLVDRIDRIQYRLGSGPCVDAIVADSVFRVGDLRVDPRWPEFGTQAFAATGVLSMLAFRLYVEDGDLIAALNLYAMAPNAFDETAQTIGMILATHGALAVAGSLARERAEQLQLALASNREIGIAVGVLMTLNKLTRDQAFDVMRMASQRSHRKLAEIAAEIAETGALPVP
jgi:hypothetical protein